MSLKNKTIDALRKFPLVFYVFSFVVIVAYLLISGEKPDVKDLDKFVYRPADKKCAPIVVLLDYDYGKIYMDSLQWLENADSLITPYYLLAANSRAKSQYEQDGLIKISFIKDEEIIDGFIVKDYLHEDSCFEGVAANTTDKESL